MWEAGAAVASKHTQPVQRPEGRVKVLLVDDSPEFLESVIRFFYTVPDIQLIGCALSGPSAIEEVQRLQPDLVLMDLALPGMNGLETALHLKTERNSPRIVMLTLHDTAEYRCVARVVGADGYVTKSELATDLVPLINHLF